MSESNERNVNDDNIHPQYMVDVESLMVCRSLITEDESVHLDLYDGSCDVDEE